MINTVRCFVPATAAVLLGICSTMPIAHADDAGPLYRLTDTAAQRLLTADQVAAFKWVKGGSIEDSARANKVLDAAAVDARNRGLDDKYVRRIFENQIHATEGVEYARFAQWKLDPAQAPTAAEDLSQSRSAIDRFNRDMVAEMSAQREVLLGPDCVDALNTAREAVIIARALDPLYQQALDVATSSYCQ